MAGQSLAVRSLQQSLVVLPRGGQSLIHRHIAEALAAIEPGELVLPALPAARQPIIYDTPVVAPQIQVEPLREPVTGQQLVVPGHAAFVHQHGLRGRQGSQGDIGPAGGASVSRLAGEVLSALVAVYEQDGQVFALDPQDPDQAQLLLGITTTSASLGGTVTVQRMGTIDDAGWTWAKGLVFVGAAGRLTQEPPTTGWEIVIGAAPAPTRLNLDIDEPIWL